VAQHSAPAPGTVKAKILVLSDANDSFVKRETHSGTIFDTAKVDYRARWLQGS
jgi:hypothetical protein